MALLAKRSVFVLSCTAMLQVLVACTSERVVGDQCAGPYDGNAVIDGKVVHQRRIFSDETLVGTSCMPCDGKPRLDKSGCPTFVTFEGCGGDVCIGTQRISRPAPDGGVMDGGEESDADAGTTEGGDAG